MNEMFRDLSQTAKRTAPRSGSAGASPRDAGPVYRNDYSGAGRTYASAAQSGRTSASSRSGAASRSSSAGRSGSSSRSSAARRRAKKRRQRAVMCGFLLLLLLLAAAIFVLVRSCSSEPPLDPATLDPAAAVFPNGVAVNGIALDGKTVDEARGVLMPGIEQTVSRIAISLTGEMGGQSFHESISGADMNITTDIEQVMLNALSGGRGQQYYTTLAIDYAALDARIAEINNALAFGPADASCSLSVGDNGKPNLVYTEGRTGMGIDIPATEQLVREALERGDLQANLTPKLTQQEPLITVDDLKKQLSLISSCTTEYRNKGLSEWTDEKKQMILNRSFNVNKAAELINGKVVQPGGTFSYNKTVGSRDEKGGWKEANAIVDGGAGTRLEYGGGVCQVSTTLYNALLKGNIQIVSRRKHSIPSDYIEKGLDATVDTDHIDFKFKNNTQYPLYIFAYTNVKKGASRWSEITVLLYGQALPDGVTYNPRSVLVEELIPDEPIITYDKKLPAGTELITVQPRNGYKVDVFLDKLVNGTVAESQLLYTDEYEPIRQKITMGTLEPTPDPYITFDPGPPFEELP